ncbi:tail fiber assembly protein [Chromobacterium sp. TRC.1.1.SA]|uniref:Tail fiber assembly protein n=1 Tax=Chromobacterium indicum TaxID=3110228 RepID=A0ABV0CQI7_9NEIS
METQKTVYSYHPQTGEYLGSTQATLSPMDLEEFWLVPAFATEQQPPQPGERQIAVYDNQMWALHADWREVPLWSKADARLVSAVIGDTPDSLNATELQPPAFAVWRGDAWGVDEAAQSTAQAAAVRRQVQERLTAAYQNRRPLEDAAELGMASPLELSRLEDWKRYCVQLSRVEQLPIWPKLEEIDWPKQPI